MTIDAEALDMAHAEMLQAFREWSMGLATYRRFGLAAEAYCTLAVLAPIAIPGDESREQPYVCTCAACVDAIADELEHTEGLDPAQASEALACSIEVRRAAKAIRPLDGAGTPEGWQLVPKVPTREMWAAMGNAFYGYRNRHHDKVTADFYAAMLAAAPANGPERGAR